MKKQNLNRPITSKKIKSVIKKPPSKQSLRPDGFTGEFYQTLEAFISILKIIFQKTEEEGTLPNSFYKISITLIAKPEKKTTGKEKYRSISLMNKCKIPQQKLVN